MTLCNCSKHDTVYGRLYYIDSLIAKFFKTKTEEVKIEKLNYGFGDVVKVNRNQIHNYYDYFRYIKQEFDELENRKIYFIRLDNNIEKLKVGKCYRFSLQIKGVALRHGHYFIVFKVIGILK